MIGLVVGLILGGFAGAAVMALAVIARESDESRRRFESALFAPPRAFKTRNRAREVGNSWAIAGNGDVTSSSRMATFTMPGAV